MLANRYQALIYQVPELRTVGAPLLEINTLLYNNVIDNEELEPPEAGLEDEDEDGLYGDNNDDDLDHPSKKLVRARYDTSTSNLSNHAKGCNPGAKSSRPPPTHRDTFAIVRFSAVAGLGMLDKYYAKTDDSIMYRLGILMHPAYGRAYMERLGWEADWIKVAIELGRTQWRVNYRPAVDAAPLDSTPVEASIFDVLDDTPIDDDPFEHYIKSPPISKASCSKPLLWWAKMSPYSVKPTPENRALIQMAQDFLSAPATSVDVERAFSHGGGMVTKRRHALSVETIRANSLVSAWSREKLIPEKVVMEKLGSMHKRKKTVVEGASNELDGDEVS
uniref:HAT C-terminal dimerisation domain-containing protein n=1 Tax=Mycena chlorophos TaxID=658473 RepID=A0ABQ0L7E9_MYCCL|nr:predicted protein [Mycena chlorophos]